ncbi:MAG: hypothetical protein NVSMB26_09420 [Beijerinckiaceae bacterium]
MPKALTDNIAGHRLKYDNLVAHVPLEEAKNSFVGGGEPVVVGLAELDAILALRSIEVADVVDIGCGIGRLTRHMLREPIASYLGLDVVPEILEEARAFGIGDDRFSFEIAENCLIPKADETVDIVAAFSVITHLLDEEVYDYFRETKRVLRRGGVGIFSFLDFFNDVHQAAFFGHALHHRNGHGDILKFTTRDILRLFGQTAGFGAVEFMDGLPSTGADRFSKVPETIRQGQSICVLRA